MTAAGAGTTCAPQPRRRTDLMGFNSTWWMVLVWLTVILVAIFPLPWWW
jgi:hypothetical protein